MNEESPILGGDRVEVYRNLHKNCFSVRRRGRVVDYIYDSYVDGDRAEMYLTNATFVVQPAGRARVIREGRKNVHAFVRGTFQVFGGLQKKALAQRCSVPVTYNPYKMETFQDYEGNEVIEAAEVFITHDKVFIH